MILNILILSLVTFERLGELILANRNTKRLLSLGGREHSPAHYPLIVALHAAWLLALWLQGPGQPVQTFWLALFMLIELGRAWVLVTLGRRWTTRIIVVPDMPLVRRGPYRFVNHPNYLVVIAEILVLPLVFGLWRTAFSFTILNAIVLAIRVREENRALRR